MSRCPTHHRLALRYREVTSGGSFGANSLTQHIGIGKAATIAKLEVIWPVSRTVQVFQNVPINRVLRIRELEPGLHIRDDEALHARRFIDRTVTAIDSREDRLRRTPAECGSR